MIEPDTQIPATPSPTKMNILQLLVVFLFSAVIFGSGGYLSGKQGASSNASTTTREISASIPPETPTTHLDQPTVIPTNSDWNMYKNTEYGFEIRFPESYKALTDRDSLYGWPNAVVLI